MTFQVDTHRLNPMRQRLHLEHANASVSHFFIIVTCTLQELIATGLVFAKLKHDLQSPALLALLALLALGLRLCLPEDQAMTDMF